MRSLLWYDDDPASSLADKVRGAVRRHKNKFGTNPNVCYVHPSVLVDIGPQRVGDVRVSSLPTVLKHHFFVVVEK